MINIKKKLFKMIIPVTIGGVLFVVIAMHFFVSYVFNKTIITIPEHAQVIASAIYIIDMFIFFLTIIATGVFIWIILFKSSKLIVRNIGIYLSAIESASNHIIITDINGAIIYANKGAQNMTGYTLEEMIGNTPRLWGALMPASHYRNLWQTIKYDQQVFFAEVKNRRKNQDEYYVIMHISPIFDEDNALSGFIATEEDITKSKELDKNKTEFVNLVSHQLRTPLAGIRWTVERFLGKKDIPEKELEPLTDIYKSTIRLSELVDAMLNMSRIEAGTTSINPEQLDIVDFLNKYFKECSFLFKGKNIVFDFKSPSGGLEAIIDRASFQNIIQSVLYNAIEYTPEKGKIEFILEKKENVFLLIIKDSGIGIPPEEQNKIFNKFFRATNAKLFKAGGTGVGLFIASEAVKLVGGKIWFESEEGKGTTFYVELPIESKAKTGEKTTVDNKYQ